MSQYGGRGRGQFRNAAKPGLLGAAPGVMQRGLLDSLGPRKAQQHYKREAQYDPHYEAEKPKPGLLGPTPYARQRQEPEYERQSYQESSEYSYEQHEDYASGGRGVDHGREGRSPVARLSPEVQQLMQNLGLSKTDMEELSRLPENELSAGNLARAIRDLRSRKGNAQQQDRRGAVIRQDPRGQRSSPKDIYDPSEPTDEDQALYETDSFREHEGRDDAFQTFEQKWYSGDAKEEQSRNGQGSSILRGSRGPAAKSNPRWREEQPPPMHQQNYRPDQPLPMHHQRRQATPPRQSPPRPVQRPPPRPAQREPRSGLLGDPHDPTTKELDLLVATINKRNVDTNPYHIPPPRERRFREPERLPEPPIRKQPPPPPVQQPNPASAMLEAQMKAMQVLQSEALQKQASTKGIPPLMGTAPPGGRNMRPKKFDDSLYQFTKQEADEEGNKMRMAQGRVLYLRYKAGSLTRIVEADIIDLATPFEKVTNILLVSPKNLKEGWYQAFLELEQYDGAAAMLEHFMVRPPSVKGVQIQFQRSNYQTLKLRQDQMNRDIGALVERSKMKRNRPKSSSPTRGRQPAQRRSPDRSKRTKPNFKPRYKDSKDSREDEKKKLEPKPKQATTNNSKAPAKRKETTPSPSKAKVAKEAPKKVEKKDEKEEKLEPKSRKESRDDGHYMLVDEIRDETETKTDGKKEEEKEKPIKKEPEKKPVKKEPEKKPVKKEPEKEKPKETTEEDKKEAENVKEEPAKQNGTAGDEKTAEVKVKEEPTESESSKDSNTNMNAEKQKEILENLEQVTNMSEALLKIVQMNSTKAIIGDILNYVKTSVEKLKEMEL